MSMAVSLLGSERSLRSLSAPRAGCRLAAPTPAVLEVRSR